MSGYEQGGEAPSAGAAAASASTAGEEQQSKQRALEEKIRELAEKIKEVETEIAADKTEVKSIKNEKERVELRRAIAANTERLTLLEEERAELRHDIKKLSAPEQSTAAGGCSPTLCLPLRSLIGLPRRGIARAPLATRI
jgi:predicted RNase H-like nuclease (RuvC/YqgF family)